MGHISIWPMLIIIYWEITKMLQRKTQKLIDPIKEDGLEIDIEKMKYHIVSNQV
jgi:hypothetical protein